MKSYEIDNFSCANCASNRGRGAKNGHRGSSGGLGCGCGGVGGGGIGGGGGGHGYGRENGHPNDEGGRSHCLQVRVDINPRASVSDRTYPEAFVNECHGIDAGAMGFSSSSTTALPPHTEACFFERDLLRSEWTEVLVPVCTDDLERNVRSRGQRRREKDPPPDVAVVLQVRSAGFTPNDPPLWLLRRDFAERAVERIMSAAAAALVQPRVEMTLLGLRGAVDSLLSERASEEKGAIEDVLPNMAGSLLPAKLEGTKSHGGCDEVLCEAFWNGTLMHKVRLHRAAPSSPPMMDESVAVIPYSSRREETLAIRTRGLDGIYEDNPAQQEVCLHSLVEPASVAAIVEKDKEQIEGAVIDSTGVRPTHPRDSDPLTWFSGGRGGDDNPLGSWVTLSGSEFPSQNDESAEQREAAGKQQLVVSKTNDTALREDEVRCKGSGQLSGTTDADEETNEEESTRPPLVWVPAEDEAFGGRPFRFFLPACLVDNAAGGRTGESYGESESRGEKNGGTGVEGENVDGSSSNDDAGNMKDSIRGDLRLVFWAISLSSSAAQEASSLNVASGETDISTAMTVKQQVVDKGGRVRAAASARRRQRRGDTGRRLLGWAGLLDDELLLQPRGHRIELALSAKAGLDVSTAWSMAHDLKRYATCRE